MCLRKLNDDIWLVVLVTSNEAELCQTTLRAPISTHVIQCFYPVFLSIVHTLFMKTEQLILAVLIALIFKWILPPVLFRD